MPPHCNDIECINTKSRAYYNFIGKTNAIKCGKHKEKDMINVTAPLCIDNRCKENPTRASFNYSDQKKPLYCKAHAHDGMIDICHKCRRCIHVDKDDIKCKRIATYNHKGEQLLYCRIHIPDKEMIDVLNPICEECTKVASYNYPTVNGYRFCSIHAKKFPGMIDKRAQNIMCLDCKLVQSTYNYIGLKAQYCAKCAKKRDVLMVDVRSPKCIECNKKQRIYNFIGKKAQYCSDCKKDEMVDVCSKKCEKCNKHQALYNFKGQPALYCSKCIDPGMRNVREIYCIYKDMNGECEHVAYYNHVGSREALYCSTHKENSMIVVRYPYTLCIHEGCQINKSVATYGYLFRPKTHCMKHHLQNQYSNNNPKCTGDEKSHKCKEKPLYSDSKSNMPSRCEKHKNADDTNIVEKPCKSCNLPYFLNENNNLCPNCDGSFAQYQKIKELFIKETFEVNDIEFTTWNRRVVGGCSAYRPDFVRDKGSFMIAIDIDEHQHKSYDKECEINRMIQIHQDIGLPCVFIRYNPDQYRNNNGKLIKVTTGREKILSDLVRGLSNRDPIKNPIEDSLSVYYLYYDGYDGNPTRQTINYIDNSVLEIISQLSKPIKKLTLQPTPSKIKLSLTKKQIVPLSPPETVDDNELPPLIDNLSPIETPLII